MTRFREMNCGPLKAIALVAVVMLVSQTFSNVADEVQTAWPPDRLPVVGRLN